MIHFQRLPATEKRECALQVPNTCVSSYEGDADQAKLDALIPISGVRLSFDDEYRLELWVCDPCLEYYVARGLSQFAGAGASEAISHLLGLLPRNTPEE